MSEDGYFDAERDRRISNLARVGVISQIQGATARVTLTETLETDFLPVIQTNAGLITSWSPLALGEQVTVLSPSGETGAGVILRGLNCAAFPTPSTSGALAILAQDANGFVDQYDLDTHVRTITVPADGQLAVNIGASTQALLADGQITFKVGDSTEVVIADGTATVKGASVLLGPDGDRKPVARVGDQVTVGSNIGTITSGSSAVQAG